MAHAARDLKSLIGPSPCTDRGPQPLPLGISAIDVALPDGGLPRGQITEVAVHNSGLATSWGLWACRAAQLDARRMGVEAWCAFVDPTQSLFAPAIAAAGVDAQRLLVVQPTLEAMDRVAVKLAEAQIFSVVVVDLVSTQWFEPEGRSDVSTLALSRWVKIVRRLSLSIQGTATQIVLLTDLTAHRALPLPVALRLELQRTSQDRLRLTVAKDKLGRTRAPISLDTTNLLPEVYTGRSLRGNLEPKSTRKFDSTLAIAS